MGLFTRVCGGTTRPERGAGGGPPDKQGITVRAFSQPIFETLSGEPDAAPGRPGGTRHMPVLPVSCATSACMADLAAKNPDAIMARALLRSPGKELTPSSRPGGSPASSAAAPGVPGSSPRLYTSCRSARRTQDANGSVEVANSRRLCLPGLRKPRMWFRRHIRRYLKFMTWGEHGDEGTYCCGHSSGRGSTGS